MPLIFYGESKKWSPAHLDIVASANEIIDEYAGQGFSLTLRQLYYQFVARDLIANRQTEYKRLGSIVSDARMAGMIDWNAIVDRTRSLRALSHWDDAPEMVRSAAAQFRVDKWEEQPRYVEVWIEKDALVGVIEGTCVALDVPYFSCRGYTSQSELWGASQRIGRRIADGKKATIIHLGDHDPSGIDMTRDIEDRMINFLDYDGVSTFDFEIDRIALNYDQVEVYGPPPNPAKVTDSRAAGYIALHGRESWELDALEPTVLSDLIDGAIRDRLDRDLWEQAVAREENETRMLETASERWSEVVDFLDGETA